MGGRGGFARGREGGAGGQNEAAHSRGGGVPGEVVPGEPAAERGAADRDREDPGHPERKVMIWFQNKRQRMKQKLKYVENINLKEENDALQRALTEERQREEYLRRENRELKV